MNPRTKSQAIRDLSQNDIRELVAELGQPAFRAGQLFTWLHRGVTSFEEMSDLPRALREQLAQTFHITAPTVARKQESRLDGTVKYLWELADGNCIETVLMQYHHGNTVCISSQVGCRMGCRFCASTLDGLTRNLTAGEMLDQIRNKFFVAPDAEITIEANPGTLYKEKLQIYLEHGINRLSLGLQSPQNRELKILGRIHTWEEFQESFFMARDAGFSNINIDLMSAIPEQTYADWEKNLRTVAGLSPEHISAYSLIIEEGTPFGERKLKLPDEDTEYRMYENTAGILAEYGFHQYEISNYAKGGRECRHNKGYWQRIDYLGLGLGASSLLDHMRFSNTADMKEYIGNSAFPDKIRQNMESLTEADEMAEFMFLGLRMTEGVSMEAFAEYFGKNMENVYGEVLKKHLEIGMLEQKGDRIYLSRKGIHVSNGVMADFLL